VTERASIPGSPPPRSQRFWATVLVGLLTGLGTLRLFLLTRSLIGTVAIVVASVMLISILVWALLARRRHAAERAMANDPGILFTIVGTPLGEVNRRSRPAGPSSHPSRQLGKPVIVCLFADAIVIRPLRERFSVEPQTIRNREISAAEWTVTLPGSRPTPRLHLTTGGREIVLLFDTAGQRQQLVEFRDTLTRVLPIPVTGVPLPASDRGSYRAVVAAIAVGTVLGAGVIPMITMVAVGSGNVSVNGYQTFAGGGRSLAPGRPWGHECVPVVIRLAAGVPGSVRSQAESVVAQARAGGANLALANEEGGVDLTALRLPAKGDVITVPISARPKGATKSDGQPQRYQATWHTKRDADGRHDVLTSLKADLYTEPLAGDPVLIRKVLRAIVARTAGVDVVATTPGTGLAAQLEQSADQFSPADLQAIRVLSGCADR
jgi:hypothetical protein